MSRFGTELEVQIASLRRYARALLRDKNDADDLVQESLARALSRADRFKPGTNLRAWLFTIMHNVHVADAAGRTIFNLATPPGFDSYPHAFSEPGVYRVSCDIHPSMKAFIVTASTPHRSVADAGGRFEINGVPPGSYQASVWSADESRRLTRQVEVPAGGLDVDLTHGDG